MNIRIFCTLIMLSGLTGMLNAQAGPAENPSTVVAEVNGTAVTLGELEQKRADNLFHARTQYYKEERKALDDLIDERLLDIRARRENVTVDELLRRHVDSQVAKDPSDEQLQILYEATQTDQPFASVRERLLNNLRQLRTSKARAAYLKTLRDEAKINVTLPEPRAEIALNEHTPVRGPRNAPVIVVEFADYQCPYCKQLEPQIEKIKNEFGDKVALVYKDYPLQMHHDAEPMAEAARCAGEQGKYWEFHDYLFNDVKNFDIAQAKEHARALQLDSARFDKCLDSNAEDQLIKHDSAEATNLGVGGTPTVFVNGRLIAGAKYEAIRDAIQQELAAASARPRQTARR
ncbi:MAG: thioredoxin domain-containing protein [Acidobacteriaceae bacterium]|nr:thioredoxin domain-containing protein [Acidobacteriaceae bacterium]MBV9779670.1 thioredoxin domain-containing protein [Acidobacteriaceae bacterium]